MDDPNMHAYGEAGPDDAGPDDAEIGRQWREDSSLAKWFPLTAERLAALEAENAALKREAHTWWTAARDATAAERERCALLCEQWNATPGARLAREIRGDAPAPVAHVKTAAEMRYDAAHDTSCVGAFARARPGA